MSPRRKVQPGEQSLFPDQAGGGSVSPRPRLLGRLGRLPVAFTVAGLVIAEAITAGTLVLVSHESHRLTARRDRSVLIYVRSFMTGFASPDPFHANDYVERVLSEATGEFAKQYREKANELLIRVARMEPTNGTVLDAGVERWNDDGSANVLVVTEASSRTPEGKLVVDNAYRWVVTAKQEGDRWKISSLVQVI